MKKIEYATWQLTYNPCKYGIVAQLQCFPQEDLQHEGVTPMLHLGSWAHKSSSGSQGSPSKQFQSF